MFALGVLAVRCSLMRLDTRSNNSRSTMAGKRWWIASSGLRVFLRVSGSRSILCGVNVPTAAGLISILWT